MDNETPWSASADYWCWIGAQIYFHCGFQEKFFFPHEQTSLVSWTRMYQTGKGILNK